MILQTCQARRAETLGAYGLCFGLIGVVVALVIFGMYAFTDAGPIGLIPKVSYSMLPLFFQKYLITKEMSLMYEYQVRL